MPSIADNYYKAARPEPPRILGLQLRPYSLGHHIILRAYDSSFVTGGHLRFQDLVMGVFICSQSWTQWESWKCSWKLPVFLKIWGWISGKFNIKSAGECFLEYLTDGRRCPEVNTPAKANVLVAPWESRMKLFLVRELRLTVTEALDYPLALAWQEYCADGEAKGSLSLFSEADEQALEFAGSDRMKAMMDEAKENHRREVEEMKARAAAQTEETN